MEEIWKDIKEYEGLYQVSNLGRVRSLDRIINTEQGKRKILGKIRKTRKDSRRFYLLVDLSKNNKTKTFLVHRLVALSFINNPNNLPQINHKDENKENNFIKNLEWCDLSYNQNYGSLPQRRKTFIKKAHKINSKKIISLEDGKIFNSIQEAGKFFNIESSNIGRVCKGERKTAGGKTFKYV